MKKLAALAILLCAAPAAADYTTISPVRPLTMSDPAGLTSVGLEFQLTKWTETPPGLEVDFTNLTFDLAADIALAPHWVLLARIPVTHVGIDGDPMREDCCELTQGNLTLGGRGLWSSIVSATTRAVVGGDLTISVPTASDNGEKAVSAGAAGFARFPHDPGRYIPNTTTLKFTGLAQYYTRRFLVHGEAGLALYLYDGDAVDDSTDLGIRLAVAAGIRVTYTIALLAELNTLLHSDQSSTSIDLGLRYASGRAYAGGRVYIPIDEPLSDLDMLGFGFDLGLRF